MVRTLNAATLLAAWETAASLPMVRRASLFLAAAWPERSADDWKHAPLGERDNALLRLRASLFGPKLETTAKCSVCGDVMEAQFSTGDIEAPYAADVEFERTINGHVIGFRIPTEADLQEAIDTENPRKALLVACVESVDSFDAATLDAVVAAMAEIDPQADVRIEMSCPACTARQSLAFDIVPYFWADVSDWAKHILAEIHTLASAYGWDEADILATSAFRRRLYREMIESEL
jgi:hypothetical protein